MWQPRRLKGIYKKSFYLLGHRGVRHIAPENTLAAFSMAFEAGLDGIECDVQLSADGKLLLFHDFHMADGRLVTRLSWAELKALKADMPLLEELFELARKYPKTLLNLEIKVEGWGGKLEAKMIEAIRASGLQDRILVSSFNPLSLLKLRLIAPDIYTALLYEAKHARLALIVAAFLHVDALHPDYSSVNMKLMKAAKAKNLMVNTWTVNELSDMLHLREQGVDAIMGDYPEKLKHFNSKA
ncbi:MAG: glycerophosphodiester phosphodiesterase family protein [Deinococcales bacterium]